MRAVARFFRDLGDAGPDVLLHELAHLLVPGHGPRFWRLLEAYPRTERAKGYLEGVAAADRLPHLPPTRGE